MDDVTFHLDNRPGALADMGAALGAAGVSIEGGGIFVVGDEAIGHFLFADGAVACAALEAAGVRVSARRAVLLQRLDQDRPGQLGNVTRLMADAGVNIEVMYSDHDNQLVLVVDDFAAGSRVSAAWSAGTAGA